MIRTRKNVYYFPSFEHARDYAESNGWPVDRINYFDLGWAIQLRASGPYVGPASAGDRKQAELAARRQIG